MLSIVSTNVMANVDVYITYMGGDRTIKEVVKAALPSNLRIKNYNASALVMADYSGKQKAIAKLSKSKLVVVINQQTINILGSPSFPNYIVIENGDAADIENIKAKL